jgi:hypothetical protein
LSPKGSDKTAATKQNHGPGLLTDLTVGKVNHKHGGREKREREGGGGFIRNVDG